MGHTTDKAEIIIRRRHIHRLSTDIGFKLQPDGTYQAMVDESIHDAVWLNKLTQLYAYHQVITEANIQGMSFGEETIDDNGNIILELTTQFGG